MKEERYVYHYCAEKLSTEKLMKADGIAHLPFEIIGKVNYDDLKRDICIGDPDGWTITSLTPLGRHVVDVEE